MTSRPERTCIACRTKGVKENFLKIVKNKNGDFSIERDIRLDGRGAYICKKQECIDKCKKSKALNRAVKTVVPAEIYEDLKND